MNNFQTHTVYSEHYLLQKMEEEYNVPAYDIVRKTEPFYVPNVLSFFDMVVKHMKMSELLKNE